MFFRFFLFSLPVLIFCELTMSRVTVVWQTLQLFCEYSPFTAGGLINESSTEQKHKKLSKICQVARCDFIFLISLYSHLRWTAKCWTLSGAFAKQTELELHTMSFIFTPFLLSVRCTVSVYTSLKNDLHTARLRGCSANETSSAITLLSFAAAAANWTAKCANLCMQKMWSGVQPLIPSSGFLYNWLKHTKSTWTVEHTNFGKSSILFYRYITLLKGMFCIVSYIYWT